jgi:hypothetical protein
MHYRDKMTKTCGYAVMYTFGSFGVWTACAAAKEK